ncbi:MAG: hypothetical protein ACI9MR_004161 [Myxococcota bacterium]|jgi:hypothetical protein
MTFGRVFLLRSGVSFSPPAEPLAGRTLQSVNTYGSDVIGVDFDASGDAKLLAVDAESARS